MIRLLYPWMFVLLLLPWAVYRWLPPVKGLHGDALRVPFLKDIAQINLKSGSLWRQSADGGQGWSKGLALLSLVWILLVVAAARPQWLGEPVRIKDYGRDIMMVMDISTSMREPDFVLNRRRIDRLTAVKLAAGNFIKQRPNDRIGLILFGTRAYLQSPVTFDKQSVNDILWAMDAGMAGNSTSIGDALGLALKNIRESGKSDDKIIILLTDGENNDGSLSMAQAINLARDEKVKIYTIGVGAEDSFMGSLFGIRLAPQGGIDEQSLKQLAAETKGTYFRASDTAGLQKIYDEIDRLEPTVNEDQFVREAKDLFYWPLSGALILALLAVFLKRKGL